MDRQSPLPAVPLSQLADDAATVVGRTCWHGRRQVITLDGVAVAALVPLEDLDRADMRPRSRGTAPRPPARRKFL